MIIQEIFFAVKCNRCGTICNNGEYSYWQDKDSCIENARDSKWLFINQKHYCSNCHDNENDTPYADFPPPFKIIKNYVEKILKGYDFKITDFDNSTVFTKRIPNKLLESEKLLIEEVAGDFLLKIEELEEPIIKKTLTGYYTLVIGFKNPK